MEWARTLAYITGTVGSCVITIKRLRELAGKLLPMAVRLRPGRTYAKADALLMTMTAGELTGWQH